MVHPYFDLPTPIVIGHRGAAGEAPENTLSSFGRALADGAAIIESDVRLTADGTPVLIHDPTVDRTTDGSGAVNEMTFEELLQLDAGHRFSPDQGLSYPYRTHDIRVPSFEQALAAFPGVRFNLELKGDAPQIVEQTLAVVDAAGRADLTLLTAGDDALMDLLRAAIDRAGARVAQGASAADVLAFFQAAAGVGTAPRGPQALQVPIEYDGTRVVTPVFVEHAHANEVQVHVWTVNQPAEMHALLDMGVDGLITDFPARLTALIARRR